MGSIASKVNNVLARSIRRLFSEGESHSITMIGLDGAGKTTLLVYLQTGEMHETMPTIGFNCETVPVGNSKFQVWDIGGQHTFLKFWSHYINDGSGIIYMVDCDDEARYEKASEELWNILRTLNSSRPLLVLANKRDLRERSSHPQIHEKLSKVLDLANYSGPHNLAMISVRNAGTSTSPENEDAHAIIDAFKWLNDELKKSPTRSVDSL